MGEVEKGHPGTESADAGGKKKKTKKNGVGAGTLNMKAEHQLNYRSEPLAT